MLQQEGHLISSSLSAGLNQLKSADVHNKGDFYIALFNLSIGLERLLKANVIIHHMLTHNLAVPSKRELKGYGHDLHTLYEVCVRISSQERKQVPEISKFAAPAKDLFKLLNDFAQTARYHNLDSLSSSTNQKDPLDQVNDILLLILQTDVPARSKKAAIAAGEAMASAISDVTVTLMHGLDGSALTTADALVLPALHKQAVRYATLHIVNLLMPLKELISNLSHKAYGLGVSRPPFPQMQEFLEWLWDDRRYVLNKGRWP